MSLGRPLIQDAAKELRRAWSRTAQHWDDNNARAFESRVVEAAERHTRTASEAMDRLEEIAQHARRACADDGEPM